jgi:hypothetical protein
MYGSVLPVDDPRSPTMTPALAATRPDAVTDDDDCPHCGAVPANVQGLTACPECGWTTN